ncbi:MAG: hypothetical protein LBO73_03995, partial [Holosporaceae bacterium]|nr:hypothetical protein [Holosporaceae bacterium]
AVTTTTDVLFIRRGTGTTDVAGSRRDQPEGFAEKQTFRVALRDSCDRCRSTYRRGTNAADVIGSRRDQPEEFADRRCGSILCRKTEILRCVAGQL